MSSWLHAMYHEAHHSSPASGGVKNVCRYTSIPLHVFMARFLRNRDNLALYSNIKGNRVPVACLSTTPWTFILCLINQRHEDVWVGGGIALRNLNLGIDGGEWSASRLGHFIPNERASGTHWTGSWVDPELISMRWRKEKLLSLPGIEPWSSSP
jgi:hypothetical protein